MFNICFETNRSRRERRASTCPDLFQRRRRCCGRRRQWRAPTRDRSKPLLNLLHLRLGHSTALEAWPRHSSLYDLN